MLNVVILISGRGSNMQAIVETEDSLLAVRAIVSNRADAAGLRYAQAKNITTHVLSHHDYADRTAFDRALQACIDQYAPDAVVLAGFMRILGREFVQHYAGRLFNIHPSLLPDFKGLDTHRRVLEAGCREHGASVHFVTEDLDGGPVIAQVKVPILPNDTEDTLATRVLAKEHYLYPKVLQQFAAGEFYLHNGQVVWTQK
ncbi:phosphoribosylglycinamide formyltransferase [Thioflexithrix psekupsensis]|uniref:Phosphoribosylglycinamide formyltransferase n=1 Tax=Thioflexithrix psekupsensis TaxID=1570016 RepID=A0A251X368_9GAMM|nr:phosphoribosylglycinamide formyltransferase [Thioflexithrix psekupsensis]OUD11725.1 phosphoribosylglycinamide formyltransferase [Thioflexithrix psekupsensis]